MMPHQFHQTREWFLPPSRMLAGGMAVAFFVGAAHATLAAPPQQLLDIVLLPHSHQDAGFIVTYSHVRAALQYPPL